MQWKAGLFVAGAVAAILGMTRNWPWLLAVAALLLGAGFLLRFLPAEGEEEDEENGSTAST